MDLQAHQAPLERVPPVCRAHPAKRVRLEDQSEQELSQSTSPNTYIQGFDGPESYQRKHRVQGFNTSQACVLVRQSQMQPPDWERWPKGRHTRTNLPPWVIPLVLPSRTPWPSWPSWPSWLTWLTGSTWPCRSKRSTWLARSKWSSRLTRCTRCTWLDGSTWPCW